jgi:hypothetical protein
VNKKVKKKFFEQVFVSRNGDGNEREDAGEEGGEWKEKSFFSLFFCFLFFTRPERRERAGWCCFMRLWRSLILTTISKTGSNVLKELRRKDMKNPSGF